MYNFSIHWPPRPEEEDLHLRPLCEYFKHHFLKNVLVFVKTYNKCKTFYPILWHNFKLIFLYLDDLNITSNDTTKMFKVDKGVRKPFFIKYFLKN